MGCYRGPVTDSGSIYYAAELMDQKLNLANHSVADIKCLDASKRGCIDMA